MLQHIRFKIQENTKGRPYAVYTVRGLSFLHISMHAAFLYHSVPRFPFFYGVAFSNHTKDKKAHDRWNTLCHGLSDGSTDVGMLVGSDTYIKGIVLVMRLTVIAGL